MTNVESPLFVWTHADPETEWDLRDDGQPNSETVTFPNGDKDCLNKTMHCKRFSGTELTCYPHSDDRKGSKYSVCGWTPIIEDSIPKIVLAKHPSATEYVCNHDGCMIIS